MKINQTESYFACLAYIPARKDDDANIGLILTLDKEGKGFLPGGRSESGDEGSLRDAVVNGVLCQTGLIVFPLYEFGQRYVVTTDDGKRKMTIVTYMCLARGAEPDLKKQTNAQEWTVGRLDHINTPEGIILSDFTHEKCPDGVMVDVVQNGAICMNRESGVVAVVTPGRRVRDPDKIGILGSQDAAAN